MTAVSLPLVLTSALVDGLNPCAFSVLLSFMAVILASVTLSDDPRRQVWTAGGAYVGGMFVTYVLLGLGVVATVSFLTATHLPIRLMGFAVVIVGLWALKDAALPGLGAPLGMPGRWHGAVRRALSQTTPIGLFTAGGLVGLCTLPCSGGIYLGVLALIAREQWPLRLSHLVLYDAVFVAPLLVLLAVVGNRRVLNRIAHAYLQWRTAFKVGAGAVAVGLGLMILVTA